jgi:hypothetical protein
MVYTTTSFDISRKFPAYKQDNEIFCFLKITLFWGPHEFYEVKYAPQNAFGGRMYVLGAQL